LQEKIHNDHLKVTESHVTLARASCNIVACVERGSWCFTNIHGRRWRNRKDRIVL